MLLFAGSDSDKPDLALRPGRRRAQEFADRLQDLDDRLILIGEAALDAGFQGCELLRQFLVGGEHLARLTKARMISVLTAIAREVLRTEESIATPCSVTTKGA